MMCRLCARLAALVLDPGATANLVQCRYVHRDGTWRWLDVTYTNLLAEAAVHAIVANYRDITAQKLAEEARVAETRSVDPKRRSGGGPVKPPT